MSTDKNITIEKIMSKQIFSKIIQIVKSNYNENKDYELNYKTIIKIARKKQSLIC